MFIYTGSKEIPLHNSFELLSERDQLYSVGDTETYTDPLGCFYNYFNDFQMHNDFYDLYDPNDLNFTNNYSYNYIEENKDFCSGYFPSFITISNPKYDLISQNNLPSNIFNNYYLKTKNGQYLKQVTNEHSRYNLNYHNNMKGKYQSIRNKHFKKPSYNTCPTKFNSYITINPPVTGQLIQEETRNQLKNRTHQPSLNTETILHTENVITAQRKTSLHTNTNLHTENRIPTKKQTL